MKELKVIKYKERREEEQKKRIDSIKKKLHKSYYIPRRKVDLNYRNKLNNKGNQINVTQIYMGNKIKNDELTFEAFMFDT